MAKRGIIGKAIRNTSRRSKIRVKVLMKYLVLEQKTDHWSRIKRNVINGILTVERKMPR